MRPPPVPLLASLVLVALALVACVLAPEPADGQPPVPVQSDVSCGGIPTGACDEVVAGLLGQVPGSFVRIDLACGPEPCSRAGGSGRALLTAGDGTVKVRPWSYTGDARPVPKPACRRIDPLICAAAADRAIDELPPSLQVDSIVVTCLGNRPCTNSQASYEVLVTEVNGSTHVPSVSWWNPGPGATAPPPDAKTPEP